MADTSTDQVWTKAPKAPPFGSDMNEKKLLEEPNYIVNALRTANTDFNNWYMDFYQLQLATTDKVNYNIDALITGLESTGNQLIGLLTAAKIIYKDPTNGSWKFNPKFFEVLKYIEHQYETAKQTSTRELSPTQAQNITQVVRVASQTERLD